MMNFNELKQGYFIHLLDRAKMEHRQAKVISVGQPYMEAAKMGQAGMNLTRLVDVTIDEDGRNKTYAIQENTGVTYAGDTVLSCEVDGILREVRATLQQSQDVLASVDMHRDRTEKCNRIIAELDTAYREKMEMEGRIGKVETFMQEIKDEIRTLIKELKG